MPETERIALKIAAMTIRIIRVYADTSVFGGVFDEEFEAPSVAFFQQVREHRFQLVTSPVVL